MLGLWGCFIKTLLYSCGGKKNSEPGKPKWEKCIEGVLELVVEKKFGNCEKSVRKKVTEIRVWHRIALFYTRMRINRNKPRATRSAHTYHNKSCHSFCTRSAQILARLLHSLCTRGAQTLARLLHSLPTIQHTFCTNLGTIIAHVLHMYCTVM